MQYVRLSVIVALLGLFLSVQVMGQSLTNTDLINVENQIDRATYFHDAIADLWKVLPEKVSIADRFPVKALSFLGASSYALAVGSTGSIMWFDTNDLTAWHQFNSGLTEISACTISKEGECFAIAGNGVVAVWARNAAPSSFSRISTYHLAEPISAIALDIARSELLIGTKNGKVVIRALYEAADICSISTARFEAGLQIFDKVLGLYPGGNGLILVAGYVCQNKIKPSIRFFDRSGSCLKEVVIDCAAVLGKLQFIDEERVLASFTNGLIMTTNLGTGTSEKITCRDHAVEMSQFSADRRLLLTGCHNKKLVLWHNTPDGYKKIREFAESGHVINCALSADGSTLLVQNHMGLLDMWSIDQPFNRVSLHEVKRLVDSNVDRALPGPVVESQRDTLLEEIEIELKTLERLLTNRGFIQ